VPIGSLILDFEELLRGKRTAFDVNGDCSWHGFQRFEKWLQKESSFF
jgi:hypothetical protein